MSDDSGSSDRTTAEPLYGATPPPTKSSPSAHAESSNRTISAGGSTNPLFGAMPDPNPTASTVVEGSARPVTSGVGTSSAIDPSVSRPGAALSPQPPAVPSRPSRPPRSRSPSSIPAFLRKLTWILSLTIGVSSAIALIFSSLILPRLHASYSARKALLDQQSSRLTKIVETLRLIRSQRIYGVTTPTSNAGVSTDHPPASEGATPQDKEKPLVFEEISSASSTTGDPHPSLSNSNNPSLVLPDTSSIHNALSNLAMTRSNTSTTRTSLLSTLESYTGALHRALWRPKPGHGGYAIGMNSLSANLAKERYGSGVSENPLYGGSADGGLESVGIKSRGDEYDAVRREIRGIKGMLLNRRNFTPLSATSG